MAIIKTMLGTVATLLCITQILEAGVAKRTTTASPSTGNQLQEALTRAQQAVSNAATEVSQALGLNNLPAPETVASQLHNQSLSFARTVGQFVGQLQNEISAHQGEFTNLLQSVATKWNETATNLQAHTTEVTRTTQELRTSFNSGLQSFFDEAQKIVNAIVPNAQAASDNLQQIARTALDRVQETANEFRSSLQATTQNTTAD
uniref:Apolipophorin-III isoform 2 n=1 Tax=Coptotermes formosanus TaxID=36987 RepID=L0ATJ3_COPFO|nr:apolipophorin-III isoform 2 [Coptotermes formosanus]